MCLLAGMLDSILADMSARSITGKEPMLRPLSAPPGAKDLQQPFRKHDVAVAAALALLYAYDHSGAVDAGDGETDCFRDA